MNRLTARTEKGLAYLVNVKPDEQEVDSPYKNTLQCILDCFERLAQYEDADMIESLQAQLAASQRRAQDARNELCERCGRYLTAHNGSCDGCRWKEN